MQPRTCLSLFVVLLVAVACVPLPEANPTTVASTSGSAPQATQALTAGWQTYTNPAGFSIQYPPTWKQTEVPPSATAQGVALDGPEGTTELWWGTGFGGACPQGYTTVRVAQGELPACHTVGADGIQHWEQINKQLTATSFSGRANTKDATQASGDAVLAVLATLAFGAPSGSTGAQPSATGLTLVPPAAEVCNGMAQALAEALSRAVTPPRPIEVTQANEPVPMTAVLSGGSTVATGTGCRASGTGTGEQFASPDAVMKQISAVLTSGGWKEDRSRELSDEQSDGWGFRSGNLVALAQASWSADPSANCPGDKPLSDCNLTPAQKLYNITLDTGQEMPQATVQAPLQGAAPAPAPKSNPAAENCLAVGGTPKTETRPDGGQYGVCYFGDNYVCEQWALMRGECPVGGVKVTGYNTPAARYCAITGGKYTVIGTTNTGQEAGSCALPSGKVCDADEYYNGTCSSSSPEPAVPTATAPIGKPNPASQNCSAVGGTLKIEQRGDGAQMGVCYFPDNKQCEEWALERGDCPVGGVKVTGYSTLAARYCAITGGKYTATGTTPDGQEAGDCALPSGEVCNAWSYYNGYCGTS